MTNAFVWEAASPESQGLDGARLRALQEELARRGTKALLIVRNNRIVWEWYAPGHGPEKLSLGFARISGPPDGFSGVNIRSPGTREAGGDEQKGNGPSGRKASGMLMVDGVLADGDAHGRRIRSRPPGDHFSRSSPST